MMVGWTPYPFSGIIEAGGSPLLQESFVQHRAWRFKLSAVGQKVLADHYGVTVGTLTENKVNHTHFISTLAAVCKQLDKSKKDKLRLEKAAISRSESQLKEAQKAEREALDSTRSRALDPLVKKQEQAFSDLRDAVDAEDSVAEGDAKARLRAAKTDILRVGASYDDLSVQLSRKHSLELADLQASEAASKDHKKARVGLRAAPKCVPGACTPSPALTPNTTDTAALPKDLSTEVSPGVAIGDPFLSPSPSTPSIIGLPDADSLPFQSPPLLSEHEDIPNVVIGSAAPHSPLSILPSDNSKTTTANVAIPTPAPHLGVCPRGATQKDAANPFSGFMW